MKNLFINKVEPSKWIAQVGIPDGYTISVKDYVLLSDGKFSCTLIFSMFDHFGLNEEDFHKGNIFKPKEYFGQMAKRALAGFRACFFCNITLVLKVNTNRL